jgi:NADH-quinone oxidoreductase subunit N
MDITIQDYLNILPLIIVAAGILISVVIEMYSNESEKILPWFSIIIFFSAGYYALFTVNSQSVLFSNMIVTGGTANIFFFLFCFGAAIVSLLSVDYLKKAGIYFGEYYILLQSAVLGMMLMANARDLVMIFIGLEQMSVSFYVLAGFNRKKHFSNEAALKYFLLGAFATGFIVYGMGLIYGSVGSMSIEAIIVKFSQVSTNAVFIIGVLLFVIGFSFKIAAFPFHMWVPDVYQGSPTTVAAIMSTGGKAAAFSALIIAFTPFVGDQGFTIFKPFLSALAVLSMLFGSIVAIAQKDIKRMLAYSSISHAGYMLIGITSGLASGTSGVIFYLAAYTFMNLGAFGIVSILEGENDTNLKISDYVNLGKNNPLMAGLLSIFMFALSGLPPFAGFFGKYYVFISAIESGMTWLAIVGVISSVISVYFYIRLVVLMYFKEGAEGINPTVSNSALLGIVISALIVILMGVFPGSIIELISTFVI